MILPSCSRSSSSPTAEEDAGRILALDEGSGQLALEKKFADFGKDVVVDEEGRVQKESKRSSFEGTQLTSIGGQQGKKEFKVDRYSKKNWRGSKDFDPAKFNRTQNRWDNEEWFVQKQARESTNTARAQGQRFGTEEFRSGSAREQDGRRFSRVSDAQTDIRRRVYRDPLVIDKDDYEKLSLEETQGLLGR